MAKMYRSDIEHGAYLSYKIFSDTNAIASVAFVTEAPHQVRTSSGGGGIGAATMTVLASALVVARRPTGPVQLTEATMPLRGG